MNRLKVYKASAGSGKTFMLVLEYLKIALKNPTGFRNILAITFTNKATEEFKRKLFYYLEGIIEYSSRDDISAMRGILEQDKKLKDKLKTNSELLMKLMLHNYSDISILTIDSFFTRILRSFALEMNLSFANKISLDTNMILDEIIESYFNDLENGNEEIEILKSFLEQKISEGKSRYIENNIKEVCQELFKDRFYHLERTNPVNKEYIEFLKSTIYNFNSKILEITKNIEENLAKYNLSVSDFKGGEKGLVNNIINFSSGKFSSINLNKWKEFSETEDWSSSGFKKAKKNINIIDRARIDFLQAIVDKIILLFSNDYKNYSAAEFILENIYSVALLNSIRKKIDEYQLENKTTIINELNRLINIIIRDNYTSPYIYEKIGIYYHHILIDEFQDTSKIQIENLKPLIEEILSNNGNAIIVGDEKQSIYRFRDAYPDYFINIDKFFGNSNLVEYINIKDNFRSAKEIVNFNNKLFRKFIEKEELDYIKSAYGNLEQDAFVSKKGYVQINFLDNENSRSNSIWKNKSLELLYDTIIKQYKKGFKFSDMLILVDRNKEAEEIIMRLNQLKDINNNNPTFDLISLESLKLINSPEIMFLINFLRYLYNFNDEVAEFAILNYLKVSGFKGYEDYKIENYKAKNSINSLQKSDEDLRNTVVSLSRMNVKEILIKLSIKYNLFEKASKYVFKLIDLTNKSSENSGSDIKSFIEYWDENKENISISGNENENAVEIMSIHKSKGLQRKIIFIPFCRISLEVSGSFDYYWTKHFDKQNRETNVYLKMTKQIFENDIFKDSASEERKRIRLDKINKLYVAFTRAEEKLFIFTQDLEDKGTETVTDTGDLLNNIIPELEGINKNPTENYYFTGDDFDNTGYVEIKDSQNNFINSFGDTLNWRDKLVIEKSIYNISSVTDKLNKIIYGNTLHKLLSMVTYSDELEKAIKHLSVTEYLSDIEISDLNDKIQKLFSNNKIHNWFSKAESTIILKEKPILTAEGKEFRPDRVIINNDKVEIIDFKTNKSGDYKQQMKKYKKIYQELGYKDINTYLVYVNDNEVEEIK